MTGGRPPGPPNPIYSPPLPRGCINARREGRTCGVL